MVTTQQSSLKGFLDLLTADPIVRHAVGEITVNGLRVPCIVGEIDGAWAAQMPRRIVVVREEGGQPETEPGQLSRPRFDLRCYGASVWEARS